ncbi:hypothetical protein KC238_13650 [Mycobacteroides chelonae]|nr:hypothetical protein [Mycobacteroides chelonae]MBV0918296.1 hypothetical protein [Mycobacteroides chelonae]
MNPALTDPAASTAGLTSPGGEVPITPNPALGTGLTNPALADPSLAGLGTPSALGGGSGLGGGSSLISDAMGAVNQLGITQAVDLIKGAIPAAASAAAPPAG